MYIKNGHTLSTRRKVNGGAPQGTKLGNLLFCLTLETLDVTEDDSSTVGSNATEEYLQPTPDWETDSDEETAIPQEYTNTFLYIRLQI